MFIVTLSNIICYFYVIPHDYKTHPNLLSMKKDEWRLIYLWQLEWAMGIIWICVRCHPTLYPEGLKKYDWFFSPATFGLCVPHFIESTR